ncbi:unnamed protein product [Clavelina lepadiformis]|uniref:Uncharacterized protein n=2 Tax=Clavelina lepadiformis TaxID=159417 RepID=A0ABP0G488_CLALP
MEGCEAEEANFPEKLTEASLALWRKSRYTGKAYQDPVFSANLKSFLMSDQHLQSLSPAIKRCRRCREVLPDLLPKVNPNLPLYLQDVQRYNQELMNHAETVYKYTLPDTRVIEEEKLVEKTVGVKSWKHGLVLHEQACLVDANGKKIEESVVDQSEQTSLAESLSIVAEILQKWQR